MKQWYEELFEDYSDKYDKETFTAGTPGEVDFFEKEIAFNRSYRILDIGCGTGRHSLELARRGYSVTGIDLSESMINKAKDIALKENLKVDFLVKDARNFSFREHSVYETEDDKGNKKVLKCNERYYIPSEITWLLKTAGFKTSEIFGAKLGAFSRNYTLTAEDFEMLVIATR